MVSRNAPRHAPKGPSAARDRLRRDKDGDLVMGVATKGKGGIGKTAGKGKDLTARIGGKKSSLAPSAQKEIMKHIGAGEVTMRESRTAAPRGLAELKVGNWRKSKASTNADGGLSSLISWLEKKASNKLGSRVRNVKVKKVCCYQRIANYAGHRLENPREGLRISYGPPSLAAKLRTTTAIGMTSLRLPGG